MVGGATSDPAEDERLSQEGAGLATAGAPSRVKAPTNRHDREGIGAERDGQTGDDFLRCV